MMNSKHAALSAHTEPVDLIHFPIIHEVQPPRRPAVRRSFLQRILRESGLILDSLLSAAILMLCLFFGAAVLL